MAELNKPSTETHVVQTESGDIKITRPKGAKRQQHVTVLFGQPDTLVREQVGGFLEFLRAHAVVGLAVGFIIGLQAQTLMKQLVDSFITPLLDLLFGKELVHRQFTVGSGTSAAHFAWGQFIYALVNFTLVLLFIYVAVKIFKADKLDKPKG